MQQTYRLHATVSSELWDKVKAHNDVQMLDEIITKALNERYDTE